MDTVSADPAPKTNGSGFDFESEESKLAPADPALKAYIDLCINLRFK